MEEKELKTSAKQRFWIILVAVVMLGSIIASYAAILANGSTTSSGSTSGLTEAKVQEYANAYAEAQEKLMAASQEDFQEFVKYKSKIVAYNEAKANGISVETEDLKQGTGRKITDGDTDYYAYYVGWCADETVFDSSFDDDASPSGFVKMIDASDDMINGWTLGVDGMRLGGIRIITIPGSLGYGDTMEICGGYDKPMKFMVMPKEKTTTLNNIYDEWYEAMVRLQYAQYGIDYDELFQE